MGQSLIIKKLKKCCITTGIGICGTTYSKHDYLRYIKFLKCCITTGICI